MSLNMHIVSVGNLGTLIINNRTVTGNRSILHFSTLFRASHPHSPSRHLKGEGEEGPGNGTSCEIPICQGTMGRTTPVDSNGSFLTALSDRTTEP